MRPPAHKKLVDAIIDSEVDAKQIAERATELGATLSERANAVMRGVLRARADGKLTAEAARKLWMEAFQALSLAGFAHVAQSVKDHADHSTDRLVDAARELGPEVLKVESVRGVDKLARAAEKKELLSGYEKK